MVTAGVWLSAAVVAITTLVAASIEPMKYLLSMTPSRDSSEDTPANTWSTANFREQVIIPCVRV